MITIEEKLEQMRKFIEDNSEKKVSELVNSKEKEINEFLNSEKTNLDDIYAKKLKRYKERVILKNSEKLSSEANDLKKDYLKLKNGLQDKLTMLTRKKCEDFAQSEEYVDAISKIFENTILKTDYFNANNIISIHIVNVKYDEVKSCFEDILKKNNFKNYTFEVASEKAIGGFIIFVPEMKIKIDKTILSSLEENYDYIGMKFNNYIAEGGEDNER